MTRSLDCSCHRSVAWPLLLLLMLTAAPGAAYQAGPREPIVVLFLQDDAGNRISLRPNPQLKSPVHVNVGWMIATENPLTKDYQSLLLIDEVPEVLQGCPPYPQLKEQAHLYRFNEGNRVKAPWENPWLKPFYWVWFRIFPPKASEFDAASYHEVPLTKGTHRLEVVAVDKDGKPYTPMVASAVYNVVIE